MVKGNRKHLRQMIVVSEGIKRTVELVDVTGIADRVFVVYGFCWHLTAFHFHSDAFLLLFALLA